METQYTRRTVLKSAAATIAAPYVITSAALGNDETPPASDRITLGHIGVGNRGRKGWNYKGQAIEVGESYGA